MPATSKAMRRTAAIALHNSEQLHAKNRGMLGMNLTQLAHYAGTSEKGLPQHTKKKATRHG